VASKSIIAIMFELVADITIHLLFRDMKIRQSGLWKSHNRDILKPDPV